MSEIEGKINDLAKRIDSRIDRQIDIQKPWYTKAQNIIGSLVLALLIWLITTTNENSKSLDLLNSEIAHIKDDMEEIKESRFTNKDGKLLEERLNRICDCPSE